jgi:hypothetical protein
MPHAPFSTDLEAIRAQVEDGVPWRDGVLTHDQAMALLREVERLRTLAAHKDTIIAKLVGVMS